MLGEIFDGFLERCSFWIHAIFYSWIGVQSNVSWRDIVCSKNIYHGISLQQVWKLKMFFTKKLNLFIWWFKKSGPRWNEYPVSNEMIDRKLQYWMPILKLQISCNENFEFVDSKFSGQWCEIVHGILNWEAIYWSD